MLQPTTRPGLSNAIVESLTPLEALISKGFWLRKAVDVGGRMSSLWGKV